jgi:UDP-2,3-diacylglucosamine pyrophosphatase LpxH
VRILLVGDTHRNATFLAKAFATASDAGCEAIYQLGDFGYGWQWLSLDEKLAICKFSAIASILVEKTGIRLAFLDGNHENFDRLYAHPQREDKTREVAPGVLHLPRGYRFEIDGCRFLALGGAVSLDKMARTAHVSWWPQEALRPADVAACGTDRVDVLLSHDVPLESGLREGRHLSGYGLAADMDWYRNRLRVTEAIEATEPAWVFHGHLHHRYERDLRPERPMTVVGLASDRHPVAVACVIFDTEERQSIHVG